MFLLACVTIGLIGLVSVICAFSAGNGIKFMSKAEKEEQAYLELLDKRTPDEDDDFGVDPQNYYGDYYTEKDFVIKKISISDKGAEVTMFDLFASKSGSFSYQYGSASYALDTFEKECPVLIMYQDSMSQYQTFWITKGSDGKFTLIDSENVVYTTAPITVEGLLNDPKDYKGTYYATENYLIETIEIGEDGLVHSAGNPMTDSESATYKYKFINAEYSMILYNKACDALLLYEDTLENATRVMWLTKDTDGNYVLSDDREKEYTTEEILWKDLINDPKDYFGTYYGEQNYEIQTLSVTKSGITQIVKNPLKKDTTESLKYSYIPAGYAKLLYKKEKPALILYKNDLSDISCVLWLTKGSDGKYTFESKSENPVTYGTQKITFESLVNDPEDYFGTYVYSSNNQLTLNRTKKAIFIMNGERTEYDYFYADRAFLKVFGINYSPAIVLVNKESGESILFKIDTRGNMVFNNTNTFTKQ